MGRKKGKSEEEDIYPKGRTEKKNVREFCKFIKYRLFGDEKINMCCPNCNEIFSEDEETLKGSSNEISKGISKGKSKETPKESPKEVIKDFCEHLMKKHYFTEIKTDMDSNVPYQIHRVANDYKCPFPSCNFFPPKKNYTSSGESYDKFNHLFLHYGIVHKLIFEIMNMREGYPNSDDYTILKLYKKNATPSDIFTTQGGVKIWVGGGPNNISLVSEEPAPNPTPAPSKIFPEKRKFQEPGYKLLPNAFKVKKVSSEDLEKSFNKTVENHKKSQLYEEICPICDKEFRLSLPISVRMKLMLHIEEHFRENLLEILNISFGSENNAEIFKCPKCSDNTINSGSELSIHYSLKHGIIEHFLKKLDFKYLLGQGPPPDILGYFELELIENAVRQVKIRLKTTENPATVSEI